MKTKSLTLACAALAFALSGPAEAATEVQWWHAMSGPLGEWVNDLAKDFNASQKEYVVVPTYKGTYGEAMTAAMAAFRAGNAPDILQVYEVGTATMMAAKGAIKPVGEVMTLGGKKFDSKVYIPAVAGYYTAPSGQMLSLPFNSSTTVFYYNKDAFKAAGLDPEKPPEDLARGGARRGEAQGERPQVPVHHQLDQLDAAGELLDLAQRAVRDTEQRLWRPGSAPGIQLAPACAPLREPGEHVQAGTLRLQGPRQQGRCDLPRGRVRDDDRLVGPLRAASSKNAKFAYGIVDAALLPRRRKVRRRTPSSAAQACGSWRARSPRRTRASPRSSTTSPGPRCNRPSHKRTGYLPITTAAYELTEKSGFYKQNPGTDVAVTQMIRKTTDKSRGIRLGNFNQIRTIIDEETGAGLDRQEGAEGSAGSGRQARQRATGPLREGQQALMAEAAAASAAAWFAPISSWIARGRRIAASSTREDCIGRRKTRALSLPVAALGPARASVGGHRHLLLLARRPGDAAIVPGAGRVRPLDRMGRARELPRSCSPTPPISSSFKITAFFSVLVAVSGICISLALAVFADRMIRGALVYKTFLIWPVRGGAGRRRGAVALHVLADRWAW